MEEKRKNLSVQNTFSPLRTRFGSELKPLTIQIRFTKDVNAFVKKMNTANAATANSSLVFK